MAASVLLPLSGARLKNVSRVELHGKEFKHDVGTLVVAGLDRRLITTDAPIVVGFGSTSWRGYVLGVTGGLREQPSTISVIGMTSNCRNGRQRSWAGTDAQIVSQVAKLSKLAVAAEPTATSYPSVNQAGVSDWAFMVARAKNAGYVLYPRGPQIRFHSRGYELDRSAGSAVRLSTPAIISFTPDFSDTTDSGGPKAVVAVSGVDANGNPVQASQTPQKSTSRLRYDTVRVATSVAEAQDHAKAVSLAADWTYHARAVVQGNSRLQVGSPVFIENVPGDYEGYWMIQEVTHKIVGTRFTTNLLLGIDRLGRGYSAPSTRAVILPDQLGEHIASDDILLSSGAGYDPESAVPVTTGDELFPDFDPYNGTPPASDDVLWTVAAKLPDVDVEEVDWQTLLTPGHGQNVVVTPTQAHLVARTSLVVGGFTAGFSGAGLVASSSISIPISTTGTASFTATSTLNASINPSYPATTRYPSPSTYPSSGVDESSFTVQSSMPFNTPSRTALRSSGKRVMPHYFTPHALSVAQGINTPGGAAFPSYYDANFLPENQPVTGAESGNNIYGGLYRNHPQRILSDLGTNWDFEQRKIQVQEAYDAGYDGFYVECLDTGNTSTLALKQLSMFDAVPALGLTGQFDIVPMIDMTGAAGGQTAAQISACIEFYRTKPAQLFVGGKQQVAIFAPEVVAASFWASVKSLRSSAGYPIDLTFCYVADITTVAATYDASAARHGRWGDRDPVSTGANNNNNRDMSAWVWSNFGKPTLGYAAPGDERPHLAKYYENRLTEQWETSWDAVINGHKPGAPFTPPTGDQSGWLATRATTPAAGYQPDIVQVPTWNDYSEGAMIETNRNYSYLFLDLGWYHQIKFKTGAYPTIVRDCVYLSHRVEFSTGMTYDNTAQTTLQTLNGATAASDLIRIDVFATAASTAVITAGGTDYSFTIPASGYYVFTTPLVAGAANSISAKLVRSSTTVAGTAITSPWAVSHRNWSQDKSLRGGSSLRGWPSTGRFYVPTNPLHSLPVT